MLELFFLSLGILLIIEGAIYFLFPNKMKNLAKIFLQTENSKIKNVALFSFFLGFCLIYFNFKY